MRMLGFLAGTVSVFMLMIAPGQCLSIDDAIAASYESVDEFDRLADMSGSTIRQELDMWLTREQAYALHLLRRTEDVKADASLMRKRRKAIRSLNYRWTNNVIPYTIATSDFEASERATINEAIAQWKEYTCLNFRPATQNDRNKIYFANGMGCSSYVGMVRSGSQKISLAKGCRHEGIIVHEIGHAVGFHHEQNRPDRDDYIRVIKDNIPDNLYYNFKKYPSSAVDTMDVPYDYGSVMHYGGRAFTKNGQYTIRTIRPADQSKIGNRRGLSYYDIMLANRMYKCNANCDQTIRCPEGAFLGKNCKCWCPGYPVRECESTGTVTTTESPIVSTTPLACKDQNKHCGAWAKAGYCARNTFVKTYCKQSCGFCSGGMPTTQATCQDLKQHCTYWGEKGYCQGNFEVFMSENCPKTCKICGSVNESPNGGNSASLINASLSLAALYSVLVAMKTMF